MGKCLVLQQLDMPYFVDVNGRPDLFLNRNRGVNWRVGTEWRGLGEEEGMETVAGLGYKLNK